MIVCCDESLDLGAKRELLICKTLLHSSMADESCWATTTLRCFQWFCLHCLIQHKHTVLLQSKLRFRSLKLNTFSHTQIHPGFVRITHIFIFDAWQSSRFRSKNFSKSGSVLYHCKTISLDVEKGELGIISQLSKPLNLNVVEDYSQEDWKFMWKWTSCFK